MSRAKSGRYKSIFSSEQLLWPWPKLIEYLEYLQFNYSLFTEVNSQSDQLATQRPETIVENSSDFTKKFFDVLFHKNDNLNLAGRT